MTILDDIGAYLVAQSTVFTAVGGTTGDVALGQMLDTQPDTVLAVYVQPGLANAYAFSTSANTAEVVYESPGLQLLSRSSSPVTAENRIRTAYTILDGLANTTLAGSTVNYHDLEAVQAPFQLGRDDNQRHLWSVNFNTKRDVT